MVIPVEYPFNLKWKHARLYMGTEQRRMVQLASGKEQKTISYARYLMSVKLGRELRPDETVDHIDNNKLNDDINNLQILTWKENIDKYQATLPHNIHGTSSMYHKGCRCDACVKYKKDYVAKYNAEHPEKRKEYLEHRKENAIEKICEHCGKTFYIDICHKEVRFCSRSCATKHRNIDGPNRVDNRAVEAFGKPVIDLDTNEVFRCATDYARYHGLDASAVAKVCRGERKNVKGHRVTYL